MKNVERHAQARAAKVRATGASACTRRADGGRAACAKNRARRKRMRQLPPPRPVPELPLPPVVRGLVLPIVPALPVVVPVPLRIVPAP